MGFVLTSEQIAQIEAVLARPRYSSAQRLSVELLTAPEALAALLPPPLEPAERPLVTVTIGRWRSNCAGDFAGATIHLAARHDGVAGGYALAMYMDAEPPVAFGREVIGEPKKLGHVRLFGAAGHHVARLERGGRRLISLELEEQGPPLGPSRVESVTFNVKARTAACGRGLEEDAILTRTTFVNEIRALREGSARVALSGTALDPLDEIPIAAVLRGIYCEYDAAARTEAVAKIPAAHFLPYHYGRIDDPAALDPPR